MIGEIVGIAFDIVSEVILRAFGWIGCLVVALVSIGLIGLLVFLVVRS